MAKRQTQDEGSEVGHRGYLIIISVVALALVIILSGLLAILTSPKHIFRGLGENILQTAVEGIAVAVIGSVLIEIVTTRVRRADDLRRASALRDSLSSAVQTESRSQFKEIVRALKKAESFYNPSDVFLGQATPDPRFNGALNHDLRRSETYHFEGTGGVWTAVRLHNLPAKVTRVFITLPSPARGDSYNHRLRYEHQLSHNQGKSYSQVEAIWRRRIAQAIVGMFLARSPATVSIRLVDKPFNNRYEVLDTAAYICAFDRNDEKNKTDFPETLRFEPDSFFFPFLTQLVANPGNVSFPFTLTRSTTEAELTEFLTAAELLGPQSDLILGEASYTLRELTSEFEAFQSKNDPAAQKEKSHGA